MKIISLFFSGISNKSYSITKTGNESDADGSNISELKACTQNGTGQSDTGMQICNAASGRDVSMERSVSHSRRSSAKTSELPSGNLNILYCNLYREISFTASFELSASSCVSQPSSASGSFFKPSSPSSTAFSTSSPSVTPTSSTTSLTSSFNFSSRLSHSSCNSNDSISSTPADPSNPSASFSSLQSFSSAPATTTTTSSSSSSSSLSSSSSSPSSSSASESASAPARNPVSCPNTVSTPDCYPNSNPTVYSNQVPTQVIVPDPVPTPDSYPTPVPAPALIPTTVSTPSMFTPPPVPAPDRYPGRNQTRNPVTVSVSCSGVTGYDSTAYSEFSGELLCLELFCREYMEHKSLRQKTRSFYEKVISCHIAPHYDKFPDLRTLTPIRVAEIIIKPIIAEDKISTAYNTRNTIVAVINHARIVHDLSMYPQFGNFNTLSQLARIPQRCDYEKSFAAMINGDIGGNIVQIFELFHQRVKNIKILVLLELTFHLCLRQNEVLNIRKSDIDFRNHCLHITETKTISARKGGFDVPLTNQTEELLKYIINAETNREENSETEAEFETESGFESATDAESKSEARKKCEGKSKLNSRTETATGRRKTAKSTVKEQEKKKGEKDEPPEDDRKDNRDPEKKNELSNDKKGEIKETGKRKSGTNSTKKDLSSTPDASDLPDDPSAPETTSDRNQAPDKNTWTDNHCSGGKQGKKNASPDLKENRENCAQKVSGSSGKNEDQDDYIFTSAKLGKRIATNALGVYFNRIEGLRGNQTAHGIRAIFKTWAHRNKIDDTISECVLSHRCWSKVAISYNRDLATYLYTDRQELMKKWSDFLSDSIGNNSVLKRSTDESKIRKGRKPKNKVKKS